MLKLWKFYWDCGRSGELQGVFLATEEVIKSAIGQQLYCGEVLGKFSEIRGKLEFEDLECLTDDQDFIAKMKEYRLLPLGFNPLNYLRQEED